MILALVAAVAFAADSAADSAVVAPAYRAIEPAVVAPAYLATDTLLWSTTETVVVAGTVLGTLAWMPLDQELRGLALRHHSLPSRLGAAGAKAIGDGYITLPISGALWLLGEHAGMPRLARASKNGLESWLLTQALVQVGKYGFHRQRPSESTDNQLWGGPGFSNAHLSFPSGHSASAWGLLPAFALEYSDHPVLVAAIYFTAAATSVSRVHDGQHWSSDVFFSAGTGYLVNRLVRHWNLRKDSRVTLVPILAPGLQGVAITSGF